LPLAAKLTSGIHRRPSHMALFKDRLVSQDVNPADVDVWSADDHCHVACAAPYAREDLGSPVFRIELPPAYAPEYMGAAIWCFAHLGQLAQIRADVP